MPYNLLTHEPQLKEPVHQNEDPAQPKKMELLVPPPREKSRDHALSIRCIPEPRSR